MVHNVAVNRTPGKLRGTYGAPLCSKLNGYLRGGRMTALGSCHRAIDEHTPFKMRSRSTAAKRLAPAVRGMRGQWIFGRVAGVGWPAGFKVQRSFEWQFR